MNQNINYAIEVEEGVNQTEKIVIGSYSFSLTDLIGGGNSSSVYKARNISTGEILAIKAIELKRVSSAIEKQLLENEKLVVKRLIDYKVEGVVAYKDVIETRTHLYLVMQHCPRGDLEKLCKQGRLAEESVQKYLLMLLNAYIGMSEIRIVHRDLKPANLILDGLGNLKIADFGFAIFQEQNIKNYSYCLGSVAYSSPQSLQKHEYGIPSDIWAIGIITFKMLTGRTPWKGKNNKNFIENVKKIPIVDLTNEINNLPLRQFIMGCCQINIDKRHTIAQLKKMAIDLEKNTKRVIENHPYEQRHSELPLTCKSLGDQKQIIELGHKLYDDQLNYSQNLKLVRLSRTIDLIQFGIH